MAKKGVKHNKYEIEFVKKVLIYIPRKIIGIIVLAIVLYTVIVYFKTKA